MNKLMENLPDLSGKCVSITIMDDDTSHDLNDPHFEIQGGRLFIAGTVPDGATSSNWVVNCQSVIAWDRVTDYFIFENLESYIKAIEISADYHKDDSKEDE
jgi:hypothetical protein